MNKEPKMNIKNLKIFLSVYRHENITQAAKELYMSQPSVSRAIQEIENYYGIKLFERVNQRIHITQSGKKFYSHALHIVESFDIMEKEMKNYDEFGILRVGTNITLGNIVLPKVISQFSALYPNVTLSATVANIDRLCADVWNNELDFIVVEGEPEETDFVKELVATDKMLLVMNRSHNLARCENINMAMLENESFLLREKGSAARELTDHIFAVNGMKPRILMESSDTLAIINGIKENIGLAILPALLINEYTADGEIISGEISDANLKRNYYIVYHKNKFMSKTALKLMDCFREMLLCITQKNIR